MDILDPEDVSLRLEYVTKYWSSLGVTGTCHMYCNFLQCVFVYIMLLSFELTGGCHIGVSSAPSLSFFVCPDMSLSQE